MSPISGNGNYNNENLCFEMTFSLPFPSSLLKHPNGLMEGT